MERTAEDLKDVSLSLAREALDLYRQGRSREDIAAATGIPTTQVGFALSKALRYQAGNTDENSKGGNEKKPRGAA